MGIRAYNAGHRDWELAGYTAIGTILGGTIGVTLGIGLGYLAPEISAFLGSSITLFDFIGGTGELIAVSVTGAQLVAAGVATVGALGMYTLSKNKPGMSTKPPVNWTTIEKGKEAYLNNKGNIDKATKQIMDDFWGKGNWSKDYKYSYNEIHKWISRIIRTMLK